MKYTFVAYVYTVLDKGYILPPRKKWDILTLKKGVCFIKKKCYVLHHEKAYMRTKKVRYEPCKILLHASSPKII